ncbi:SLC13 family permease [Bacillus sp. M6-12]|uniref:SLC13 family permease n=1 Tax=Bacillus sp. M6-12 TaxID=2054166 RepID=UPI000C78F472|nr:SLC13 family permease [Bacillus sp. M6-12]PLS16494.1 SLC13 family permease [Bacillus sp. M6-12]
MTQPILLTFIILAIMTALFIQGKIRNDLTAGASLLALTLLGIVTPEEALSGFSNPVVIMLAGLYIVGAGVFNTGLAGRIGNKLLLIGGKNETWLLFIIMLTVALMSGLLSNTGTVAILLPVVVSMAIQLKISPSKFLIPLAYASSLGGVLTIIGTPPNLIISSLLSENGFQSLSLLDITPIGLIALSAGVLFMMTIGRKLLPDTSENEFSGEKGLSANELAGMYKIYDRLSYLQIPAHSEIVGERLMDLSLPIKYEITVIAIKRTEKDKTIGIRQTQQTILAKADEVLHPDDLILVFGEEGCIASSVEDYELEKMPLNMVEIKKHFLSRKFGLTEILIVPNSEYENRTLRDIHFREKYQCNALAINRKGEYIQADVGTEFLKPGDSLLVHGKWENIERLSSDRQDMVVIGSPKPADEASTDHKAPYAAAIMILMLVSLAVNIVEPVLSVSVAALLMIITGCLRSMDEAYQRINWESIVMVAAMLPMAIAFETTGGAKYISDLFLQIFDGNSPYFILTLYYLLTMVLSQFISNAAAAIMFAPIAITSAVSLNLSPYPFLICVAIASSMAFSTPVAAPANSLVMSAGGYQYKDFVKTGFWLQLFIGAIMIAVIPLFFPF